MEPYKVLLADDEEDIRVGISQKMDWAELGFTLVGEADNGQDALELAESLLPDVVLTDIKMPFLDGLELCRILTEQLPASKFVVFSGFDDFEYAKQASDECVGIHSQAYQCRRALRRTAQAEGSAGPGAYRAPEYGVFSLPVHGEPARFAGAFLYRLLDGRIPPGQEAAQARRLDIDLYSEGGWVAALAHIGSGGLKSTMAPAFHSAASGGKSIPRGM